VASVALPRAVARRVDRLARHAHAFHRFAHHPLCAAYEPEVLRMGRRTRVCRGCTAFYGGALAGVAIAAVIRFPAPLTLVLAVLALGLLAGTVIARARMVVTGKLLTRALPGVGLGYAAARAVREPSVATWIALGVGAITLAGLAKAYRRRGPDRSPCQSCPQYTAAKTCDGFAPIVRRERAFMRLSARWTSPVLPMPKGPGLMPTNTPPAAPR
jgi:hypothetical protein